MIGALIGAGASLLGGLFNRSSSAEANRINQQNALRQEALQREFAQSGIQWKVEDAKKAGIHPLYALGANTVSYQPNVVGAVTDNSLGSAIASSGQDISRAMQATQTAQGRESAYIKTVQDMSIQKMGLENEMLATQIAKLKGAQLGPPMPSIATPKANALGTGFGGSIPIQKDASDAEDWQTRYGDFVENVAGLGNLVYDLGSLGYRNYGHVPAEIKQAVGAFLKRRTWRGNPFSRGYERR